MEGGLPFALKRPRYNAETEAAMREAREIAAGKRDAKGYATAKALLSELDSEC
jgi:DNA-damage-inducible protein J